MVCLFPCLLLNLAAGKMLQANQFTTPSADIAAPNSPPLAVDLTQCQHFALLLQKPL